MPGRSTVAAAPALAAVNGPAQAEPSRRLLAALSLAAGSPMLLAFTRGCAAAATTLCAEARAADLDVRLLGLSRWDIERFQSRLVAFGRGWPTHAPRRGVLLADADVSNHELADLAGFSLLLIPPADTSDRAGLAADLAPSLPDHRELVITGPQQEALVLSRRTPLRWEPELSGPGGQLVRWPPGRLQTAIDTADGRFVADGEWEMNRRFRGDTQLSDTPVLLVVRDAIINRIECDDPYLLGLLRRATSVHGANRIVAAATGRDAVGQPSLAISLTRAGSTPWSEASADLRLTLTSANSLISGRIRPRPTGRMGERDS